MVGAWPLPPESAENQLESSRTGASWLAGASSWFPRCLGAFPPTGPGRAAPCLKCRPRQARAGHERESRAAREDCLESPRRLAREAEPHLDAPEQEETHNRLVLARRAGLLQERVRVLQPAGLKKKPAELQVGEMRRPILALRVTGARRDGEQERCCYGNAECSRHLGCTYCRLPAKLP